VIASAQQAVDLDRDAPEDSVNSAVVRSAPSRRVPLWVAQLVVCVLAAVLASNGITDEGAVSLDGDMPHYLMNGVFVRDLMADMPLTAPLHYAKTYYARYPTLTLGHHPFVPALAEAPFLLTLGVSVFAARLSSTCALIVLVAAWFRLIRSVYDARMAVASTLLLLSMPGIVPLFQVVLSEAYTLSLIVLAVYFMHRYALTSRRRYAAAFAVSVVLSAYAKHLAVVMLPVYAFQFARAFGLRRLWRPSTLLVAGGIGVALLPLIPLTLRYSQFNVQIVTEFVRVDRLSRSNVMRLLPAGLTGTLRLTLPVLILGAVGVAAAWLRRDTRILLFVVWVATVGAGLLALGVLNERFFCYWLPPFAVLAAAALYAFPHRAWRLTCTTALGVTIAYQAVLGWQYVTAHRRGGVRPAGARGYEEAAQYVAENRRGDSVLYSAAIDSGYFVFFVRKHDPRREMIVLRADKVLTTSRMRVLDFERRIQRPEEILPILRRYGVGYVVVEDRPYPAGPLQWLQQLVATDDFELRKKIPIGSNDNRLDGATVSVYAFKGTVPADSDALLSINIPAMGDHIDVRLGDLIRKSGTSHP
jgi:4-amino-4-deoxy-L-arabinose transferase-like glycosyltransferase